MQSACYRKQKIKKTSTTQGDSKAPRRPQPSLSTHTAIYIIGSTSHIPTTQEPLPHRHNPHITSKEEYIPKSTTPPTPTPNHSSKKARGVCRGAMALWPLCGFHSPKNISSNKHISTFRLFLNIFIQYLQKI